MLRYLSSLGLLTTFSTYLHAVSRAFVPGFGDVGSLRYVAMRSRSFVLSSSFRSLYGSAAVLTTSSFCSGRIPRAANRSMRSFSSSALTRARSLASRSFSRRAFSNAIFSSCSFCRRLASFISLEDAMRAISCCFSNSFCCLSLSFLIFASRSSNNCFCSSLLSFGFAPAGTRRGSSISLSSLCSASHVTASSRLLLPVVHSARSALMSEKPISTSCSSNSLFTLSVTRSIITSSPPVASSGFFPMERARAFFNSSSSASFASSSYETPLWFSPVLSTNSVCPGFLCICSVFSVSLLHGFPHALQTSWRTGSVLSSKFVWPVSSACA
mmetsp:Transcript_41109/g.129135  ORF Transcript_41109/g.129135 Transcript_41109/m.129135 type:complete len:327 (+) Transcript_41109:250-1230(+)